MAAECPRPAACAVIADGGRADNAPTDAPTAKGARAGGGVSRSMTLS